MVSDGPAKSWAIGSAGSAPSSSRVRPFRQLLLRIHLYIYYIHTYILIYLSLSLYIQFFLIYFPFDFVCYVFPSSLGFRTYVHDMFNEYFFFLISLRTERKTCRGYFSALFLHASLWTLFTFIYIFHCSSRKYVRNVRITSAYLYRSLTRSPATQYIARFIFCIAKQYFSG